jgi:hypothetical protein
LKFLSERFLLGQGYLNDDASDYYEIFIKNNKFFSNRISYSKSTLSYVLKKLSTFFRQNNIYPIFLLKKILPGINSYHFGGTLAMKEKPTSNQTFLNGALFNAKSIHIIDGSVLNKIPAGSPSNFIMINAYRIGSMV